MKSKTSLFNVAIFKKNIKRVWPFWGLLSFVATIPSLFLFMEWIRGEVSSAETNALYVKEMFYSAAVYLAPLVAAGTAIVTAMAVWAYLYSNRSVGAYHSIPVTRTGLFITGYISGLAIMLIPYVIGGGLFILTLLIIGCGFSPAVFALIGAVILDSIFFFSFATVIAMMTGNILALPVLYIVFNFLALGVENLFNFVISNLLYGFEFNMSGRSAFFSPLYKLLRDVGVARDYSYEEDIYNYYSRTLKGVSLDNFELVLIYGGIGVVLAVIALLMYKKKKSESAGDVVSAKPLKPIMLTIYAITVTTLLGMLLYYIFSLGNEKGMSLILAIVCFMAALAIAYYSGLMLLEKSVKVFTKKTFRGFLVGTVIVVFCCFGMKYDIMGIEKRVPDASKIRTLKVYDNNFYEFDGKNSDLLEKALDIHRKIIENKDLLIERQYSEWDEDVAYDYIRFVYELKSGEIMTREYSVLVPKKDKNEFDNAFVNFISDKSVIRTLLHENDGYYVDGGYFSLYSYDSELDASVGIKRSSMDLTDEQAKKLYAAVVADLEDGNWHPGLAEFVDGYEITIGYLDISFSQRIDRSKNTYYYNSDDLNVNLTGEMTHTFDAIADIFGVSKDKMADFIKELIQQNAAELEDYAK